jgi:hypothetical protein
MDPNDDCRNTAGEGHSVAALTLVMGILFITYLGLRTAMPELPLDVYRALTVVPTGQMVSALLPRH